MSCTRVFVRASRGYSTSVQTSAISKFPEGSTIYSLIQPTGRIHLGNYLGAIRNWRDISSIESRDTKYIFGIADLHALTLPQDPVILKKNRYEAIASILAAGIDPEKCILYHQSSVPEHAELNWILTCITSMGYLNRMTQWKLKAKTGDDSSVYQDEVLANVKAGLLCYPILQTADILLYKSTHVPVGDDQSQHLELCRHTASNFNHAFKTNFFPQPKTLLTPTKKVLSLRNPAKKMSKSDIDQNSCIYVNDSFEITSKKIRKATTDSIQGKITYDPIERPGVSNLLTIISGLTRKPMETTVDELLWITNHKELKDYVSELLEAEFKDTRQLFDELTKNTEYLDKICKNGNDRARSIASTNMKEIKKLTGLD